MGPSSKAKRYNMQSGTRQQFRENLEKQFPSEKEAIGKLMKLLDVSVDGWMTCDFTSFSTVFQSYQDDGRLIMKGCVQWNSIMVEKILP